MSETSPTQQPGPMQPGGPGGRTFGQKLGIYLLGIALGLMVLGWFQMQKKQAVLRAQQAEALRAAEEGQPGESTPAAAPNSSADAAPPVDGG